MEDEMDEIWALYADDGQQALDAMETALDALAGCDKSAEESHISALFRAVHTFKGNSRVLGLAVVESRAHLAEDLIGLVRDQGVPLDEEIRDILLLAADVLRGMLEETAQTRADVSPDGSENLMDRLRDKIARCCGAEPAPPAAAPTPSVAVAPEPAPVVEAAPVPTPAPEPAPAEGVFVPDSFDELPAEPEPDDYGLVANPAPPPEPAPAADLPSRSRLVDDPVYRKIFLGMVEETTEKLRAQIAASDDAGMAAFRNALDGLAHASGQIGLPVWAAMLSGYLADPAPGKEKLAQLMLDIDDRMQADFLAPVAVLDSDDDYLGGLRVPLAELAKLGLDFADTPDHRAKREELAQQIIAATQPLGFVRVIEAAQALTRVTNQAAYREGELALYEELAAVEAVLPEEARKEGASPRALLLNWCADHIFDTLAETSSLLERLQKESDRDPMFARFSQMMRRIHRACQHYRIDMAAQLSMSLLDLFARQQTVGGAPDAILNHIAQGFISTIELVFDRLSESDEVTEYDALQRLFAEASSVAFVSEGVISASAIERKLGLPREFHRVMSPESVRAAADALDKGMRFHILRADINDDERIAEAFLDWLGQHGNRPITNVTVFRGNETLFDFLLASPLTEGSVVEALAVLDPGGRKLLLLQTLTPANSDTVLAEEEPGSAIPQAAAVSVEMLEQIGEIATGQAMIHHMLGELAEADIVGQLDSLLRGLGIAAGPRGEVRAALTEYSDRLRDIVQLETQLLAQMAHLQEETVTLRTRPADSVLRPVATLAQTLSRHRGRDLSVTTLGGELALDVTLLETLRGVLRTLATARVEAADGPKSMCLTFRRDEESVQVTLEDDGASPISETALAPVLATVQRQHGRLRQVQVPGGRQRIHVSLPMTMVVLDGMVVGVDGVRYVLPVDAISTIVQSDPSARIRVAAGGGQQLLRLSKNEIVPIRSMLNRDAANDVYVILSSNGARVALPVDEVVGQQLVLLRPLRGVLKRLRNLNGIALLAGGEVGMVLSTSALCGAEAAA